MVLFTLLFACSNDYGVTVQPDPEVIEANDDPVTEIFLTEGAPADIIFYGDTSNSMDRRLATLGDNLETFADRLGDLASDWQLLAVTGPSGCGIGGILTSDDPDYVQKFADGITTKPTDDTQDEMGLQNVAEAVVQANGGCNNGFLRDDASLHIIILSDEEDESPGFDTNPTSYWGTYVDTIIAAKGNADKVLISSIAGPVPDGCDNVEPANGYWDAVQATNGEFLSICEEWDGELGALADISITIDTFVLKGNPDPDTIEVQVEGVVVTNWAWSPPQNAVVFTSDPPFGGQEVAITFVPDINAGTSSASE